jgi:hypothetical protein
VRNEQHLSDEAGAACADGVLRGAAQDRATRHIASCAECAQAVKGQREAVWALRAAPAPPLPSSLLDRLREVPQTAPLSMPRVVPSGLDPDGSPMFGLAPMAALVAAHRTAGGGDTASRGHRGRTVAIAAAAVALTGAITASSVAHAVDTTSPAHPGEHAPAGTGSGHRVTPVHVVHPLGR